MQLGLPMETFIIHDYVIPEFLVGLVSQLDD